MRIFCSVHVSSPIAAGEMVLFDDVATAAAGQVLTPLRRQAASLVPSGEMCKYSRA